MAAEWIDVKRRPLRITTYGFWDGWRHETSPLYGLLASVVDVEHIPFEYVEKYGTNVDVALCSLFCRGRPYALRNVLTVQYCGEPKTGGRGAASAVWGDYVMGFDPDSRTTFHFPHWQHDLCKYNPVTRKLTFEATPLAPSSTSRTQTDFCAVFASHDVGNTRAPLYDVLATYQPVHSYGAWRNNCPSDNSRGDEVNRSARKIARLQQYAFNLAAENVSEPYYTTEKLSEPLLAGTVPIYWGDPLVSASPFNPVKFIDATGRAPSAVLQDVITLDRDPVKYAAALAAPMFTRAVFPKGLAARSDLLVKRVLEDCA